MNEYKFFKNIQKTYLQFFHNGLYSRFVDRKEDEKEKQDVTEKSWKHLDAEDE